MDWVPHFKDFYAEFASKFASRFDSYCEGLSPHCDQFSGELPKVWKTVGDEIIFVCTVKSCLQIFAYVSSFLEALRSYGEELYRNEETRSMDVKGNAWVASFPYPNQTIVVDGTVDLVDEQVEQKADAEPALFEFLGPGIDAGFRIAENSRTDFMTVSPALALLLCKSHSNKDLCEGNVKPFDLDYRGIVGLKGVIRGKDYPILGINTERNGKAKDLLELQKKLTTSQLESIDALARYLTEFICLHDVPEPVLKLQPSLPDVALPAYYTEEFLPHWEKQKAGDANFDENFADSAGGDGGDEPPPAQVQSILDKAKPTKD